MSPVQNRDTFIVNPGHNIIHLFCFHEIKSSPAKVTQIYVHLAYISHNNSSLTLGQLPFYSNISLRLFLRGKLSPQFEDNLPFLFFVKILYKFSKNSLYFGKGTYQFFSAWEGIISYKKTTCTPWLNCDTNVQFGM